jgi:predicted ATPase
MIRATERDPNLNQAVTLSSIDTSTIPDDLGNTTEAEAADELARLANEITYHNRAYHQFDSPQITDSDYDKLRARSCAIERQFPHLVRVDYPTQRVRVFHRSPAPILHPVHNSTEFNAFWASAQRILGPELAAKLSLVAEPKIDGISVILTYENGQLVRGATRGDGLEGDDVTSKIRTVTAVPARLQGQAPALLEIRAALFLPRMDYRKLNEAQANAGQLPFSDQRAASAGILYGPDDSMDLINKVALFAYEVAETSEPVANRHWHSLQRLRSWGFMVNPLSRLLGSVTDGTTYQNELEKERDGLGYEIGGAVYKVDDQTLQRRLGTAERTLRWAAVWRFPSAIEPAVLRKQPTGSIRADHDAENIVAAPSVISSDTRSNKARRWSKLETISIENFKAIKKTTVVLGDVTILVGPNGSGKSSVLQAVHWAARAASYIAPRNTKERMAFDRIDYLPSSEPLKTAHKGELKSETKTLPTKVAFNHAAVSEDDPAQTATVSIWAARNKGGISAHIEGGSAVTPYKQRDNFITAYIPGLAGLSERETILAQPLLRRQAASGDAGGVLRNVLFNLSSKLGSDADPDAGPLRLKRLNQLIQEVHQGVSIDIKFDEREDYNISANYRDANLGDEVQSLETAATGVLQVVQIFAYLVLFRPRIMLIDEPDAHLHPDKQERLIEALERATTEFETQIILTTHSPHIARAASPAAKLIWMNQGEVRTDDDEAIRRLLGWGGLDKDVLFFVEDEDDKPIRAILRQWPDLSRRLAVCRCFGIDNLPKDRLLEGLLVDGNLRIRAVIHRDRDFMTDEEANKWKGLYKTDGTFPWVCEGCDIEGYFCETKYLAALYGISTAVAENWRQEASRSISGARERFFEKRNVINRVLWPTGGSPESGDLWIQRGEIAPNNQTGKKLFRALKPVIKKAGYDDKMLNGFAIPAGHEIAIDLRNLINEAIAPPTTANAVLPTQPFPEN